MSQLSTFRPGALLLGKLSRTTLTKAATPTTSSKTAPARPPAATVNLAFAALQRRDCLFGPMFAPTKAANATLMAGPRQDFKAPTKPSTPAGMTAPAAYRRVAPQADANEARQFDHMKATADARTALLDSIKAIHRVGPLQPNNYAVPARRLGVPSPATPYQTTGRSTLPELNTEALMVGFPETNTTVLDARRPNKSPNR